MNNSPRDSRPATLAQLIKSRRAALGLTQEDLAERVNMSQRWVSAVETGEVAAPRIDVMRRLASVLGVPIEDLFVAAGIASTPAGARKIMEDAPEYDPSLDAPLTEEERSFLANVMFLGLDEMSPRKLRRMIRIMQETDDG